MPARLTLGHVQEIAALNGGLCLAPEYLGSHRLMLWRCSKGHEWKATLHNVKAGHWCHHCAHRVPPTIAKAHEIANLKGGSCLSSSIKKVEDKLRWKCQFGHEWPASFDSVQQGSWCPHCAGKHRTIQEMQELAARRNGKCLSPTYLPNSKLIWQCDRGHVWKQIPAVLMGGTWCPRCAGKGAITLEDMQALAKSKGGQCLSVKYTSCMKNLLWQCSKGHTWHATPSNVRRTSWCPQCKQNKRERYCREVFERIFGSSFPKCRPSWLRNSRGNSMELDGYSEALQLAFEYQGFQHYELSFLHSPEEFAWQQQKDQEKRELCKVNGVTLIEVPWVTEDIHAFVKKSLALKGVP